MAFYRDKVQRQGLIDKLVQLLTTPPKGAVEPYWKQVQSGTYQNEGYILHSKGQSGTDNIFIRFVFESSSYIRMTLMEDYIPNQVAGISGTRVNETVAQDISYSNGGYSNLHPVHYFLSFDKDRVMLVLTGNPVANSIVYNTLAWIGLPKAMSTEDNSKRACFAVSRQAYQLTNYASYQTVTSASMCKVLEDRSKNKQVNYHMRTLNNYKTKGWDGYLLLPHVYLEQNVGYEGVRSIMHGVHPIIQNSEKTDFKNGDEIMVGSKRFTVFEVYTNEGVNCFSSPWMAVEQLM